MSVGGTRRAFLGAGLAAAAGAGLTRLPSALQHDVPRAKERLSLQARDLASAGASPAFGTLRPVGSANAPLAGLLYDRASERHAGNVSITTIPATGGMLRVHTIDLQKGSLVAIGGEHDHVLPISSASGGYAGARGSVTVTNAVRTALNLDIELELLKGH